MCGRFALSRPLQEVSESLDCEPLSDLTPFEPSWNVAPQAWVPIVTQTDVSQNHPAPRHMRLMRWGFRPSWAQPSSREPINARSETAHEKPMFQSARRHRRGLLPVDGWYEWMTTPQGKVPWYHYNMKGRLSYMAVIFDRWSDGENMIESYAILTRDSNEDCQPVHHRMPVLVHPNHTEAWLVQGTLPPVTERGVVDRHAVSRDVNHAKHDHAGLIQPIATLFDQEYGV